MSSNREKYMNNYGDQDRHNNDDVMLLYSIESGKRLLVHEDLFDSDTMDDIEHDFSRGCRIEKEIQYIAKYLHYGYRKHPIPSEIYKCFLYILCDYLGFEESDHLKGFPKPELLKRVMLQWWFLNLYLSEERNTLYDGWKLFHIFYDKEVVIENDFSNFGKYIKGTVQFLGNNYDRPVDKHIQNKIVLIPADMIEKLNSWSGLLFQNDPNYLDKYLTDQWIFGNE